MVRYGWHAFSCQTTSGHKFTILKSAFPTGTTDDLRVCVIALPDPTTMDASSSFLLPFYLGLAVVAQVTAQDCSRPTVGEHMTLKGGDILKDTFPDGSQATLACGTGHEWAKGDLVITCTAGVWSPVTLECERRFCEPAQAVTNGYLDYSGGSQYGDILRISCKKGYIMSSQNSERTCLSDGKWSGHPPSCEVVICQPPQELPKGSFSPVEENYKYGDVVQYTCDKSYVLNGSERVSCSDDRSFKPGPPVCVEVQCPDLDFRNLEFISGAQPPYEHNEFVKFGCKSGYEMVGHHTVTCQIDSRWSPEPPICRRIQIPTTTTTVDKKTTTGIESPPTTTPVDKEPTTASPKPDDKSGGNHLGMYLGVSLAVILGLAAIILVGCYYCGGLAFLRRKRKNGYRKGRSKDEAAKDGEGVVLS
ncbi:membrane cofactor protein-like isoform X3 [Festucalex cinctus]